jgi:hypothetical protein
MIDTFHGRYLLAHCMMLMYTGVVHDEHTFWYKMYLVDILLMIIYFIVDISVVS